MNELLRVSVIILALILCQCFDKVERALEEVLRKAISLDLSLYDRNEAYFIKIINQDGYEVCSGTVDRNQMKQLACEYKKEHLKYGDNTFYITVFSKKNKTILFETTADYHYDKSNAMWLIGVAKESADNAQNAISIALGSLDNGTAPWSAPVRRVGIPVGLAIGVGYILWQRDVPRQIKHFVQSLQKRKHSLSVRGDQPSLAMVESDARSGGGDDDGNDGRRPPQQPTTGTSMPVPRPRTHLLGTLRDSMRKALHWRPTSSTSSRAAAGLLLGAALLGRQTLLPALQRLRTRTVPPQQLLTSSLAALADKLRRKECTEGGRVPARAAADTVAVVAAVQQPEPPSLA